MRLRRKAIWTLGLFAVGVVALGSFALLAPSASGGTNCGSFEGQIEESDMFTPYEARRDHLPPVALNPKGQELDPSILEGVAPQQVDGLPLQWSIASSDGSGYLYYAKQPVGSTTTTSEFSSNGGIQLSMEVAEGDTTGIQTQLDQLGERSIPVEIGDYAGAVVWADPENESGLRVHYVFWDQDKYHYSLIIDASPEDAVTVAREVACGLSS